MSSSSKSSNEVPPAQNASKKEPEQLKKAPEGEAKSGYSFFEYIPHEPRNQSIEKKTQIKRPEQPYLPREKQTSKVRRSSSPKSKSPERERSRQKEDQYHNAYRNQTSRPWKNPNQRESSSSNRQGYPQPQGNPYRRPPPPGPPGDFQKFDQFRQPKDYRKTKLCPHFDKGLCNKGENCNFAHSESELKIIPDYRKTKLCLAFKDGQCGRLSSECKYAHGQKELRKAPDNPMQERNFRQRKMERPPRRYDDQQRQVQKNPISNYPPQYPSYPQNSAPYGMPPPNPYYYYPPQPQSMMKSGPPRPNGEYQSNPYYPPQPQSHSHMMPPPSSGHGGSMPPSYSGGGNSYEYYDQYPPSSYNRYPPV